MISFDPNVLISYYNAKAGILDSSASGSTSSSGSGAAAPAPPWNAAHASAQPSALAAAALAGRNVINPDTALTKVKDASTQYDNLFTLYQGLNALSGLTSQMLSSTATTLSKDQATAAFEKGLGQVTDYVSNLSMPNIRITNGVVSSSDATTLAPAAENDTYTTGVIFKGAMNDAVPAFQGDVQFNINLKEYNGTKISVPIDLSQMGSTARTMPNVVNYINSQLKAAGATTRFATSMTAAVPQTIKVGSQTVTLSGGLDEWSFKINGDSAEQVSFSAPSTAAAVYVAQTSGNPNATASTSATTSTSSSTTDAAPVQQLVKLQTDNSTTSTAPPAALALPGTLNASTDEASATTLGSQVGAVHATATGPDGSIYVVADVTGTIAGQVVQGTQGVALLKYDSAGQLQSASTLGATGSASGYSIAVSSTGAVAVAGSVNGSLDPTSTSTSTSTSQSFVSVFDSSGAEQWTQQSSALGDNQANAVAFGSDGSVYIAGQVQGSLPGGTPSGGKDGYLEGFSATGKHLFTTQFGTTGTDSVKGLAVDGANLVVGGVENGDGVLRSFTLNGAAAPTAGAVRDLGSLNGGSIAGVAIDNGQVIVAGNTASGSLSAGTVTAGYSGGQDAFVAKLSENLTPSSSDAIAYYGGSGTDTATALSVVNGQVYVAGTSTGGLPGLAGPTNLTAKGTREGYVANIDVASGTVQWSQALQGQDGYDQPEAIAVDKTGASVLDRLGLPDGTLQYTSSQLLTAATSVRAGDQFQIRTSVGGPLATVTIAADETPQSLALKIRQAAGYQANVSVVTSSGKEEVKIKPESARQVIELLPGPSGKDALAPLGLSAGIVQSGPSLPTLISTSNTGATASTKAKLLTDTYGLNLDQTFDLTTTAGIKAAQSAIQTAMAKVQSAYYNLVKATTPQTPTSNVTGTVPAYLTAQIASYQDALARLTGGSSSSSSSTTTNYSSAGLASQILA